MESVQGKMTVSSVEEFPHGAKSVNLSAVYSTTPEDNTYAEATPWAQFKMTVNNPAAADFFKPGNKYKVTFTEWPE